MNRSMCTCVLLFVAFFLCIQNNHATGTTSDFNNIQPLENLVGAFIQFELAGQPTGVEIELHCPEKLVSVEYGKRSMISWPIKSGFFVGVATVTSFQDSSLLLMEVTLNNTAQFSHNVRNCNHSCTIVHFCSRFY